jgi:hypothetical protein
MSHSGSIMICVVTARPATLPLLGARPKKKAPPNWGPKVVRGDALTRMIIAGLTAENGCGNATSHLKNRGRRVDAAKRREFARESELRAQVERRLDELELLQDCRRAYLLHDVRMDAARIVPPTTPSHRGSSPSMYSFPRDGEASVHRQRDCQAAQNAAWAPSYEGSRPRAWRPDGISSGRIPQSQSPPEGSNLYIRPTSRSPSTTSKSSSVQVACGF